jgi:hypothetical protein
VTRFVKLSRAEVEAAKDPDWAIAHPVYQFLASTPESELSPHQKVARLVLFYSNEVDNGGHLQYFHNQGMGQVDDLIAALDEVGGAEQRKIFEAALAHARDYPVSGAETLEDYSDRAYERDFWSFDKAFYDIRPELGQTLLPEYIKAHLSEFAVIE